MKATTMMMKTMVKQGHEFKMMKQGYFYTCILSIKERVNKAIMVEVGYDINLLINSNEYIHRYINKIMCLTMPIALVPFLPRRSRIFDRTEYEKRYLSRDSEK